MLCTVKIRVRLKYKKQTGNLGSYSRLTVNFNRFDSCIRISRVQWVWFPLRSDFDCKVLFSLVYAVTAIADNNRENVDMESKYSDASYQDVHSLGTRRFHRRHCYNRNRHAMSIPLVESHSTALLSYYLFVSRRVTIILESMVAFESSRTFYSFFL